MSPSILDRKLRRDLQRSWRLLLTVTAIIAAGVGSFTGMLSASRNLEGARTRYYSDCRFGDFWIDLNKAPVEEVERLSALPGISEVRHRLRFKVIVDLPEVDEPVSAMVLSLPGDPESVINGIVMRSGSYFTYDRPNEVIVSEKFARARGIEPGDRLHILMNERREELVVAGSAITAEHVYLTSPGSLIDDPKNYGLFFLKRTFLEDTFGFEGACNEVTGQLAPEARGEHRPPVVDQLAGRLEPFGVFATTPRAEQFSHMTLSSEMRQLLTMAVLFPAFFLVVAGLVLNVLMTRMAEQQRTVLGTLKALGYGNRELLVHFLKFGLSAGLLGGVMGNALGFWFAGQMTTMYLGYFSFPSLVNAFYPGIALAGLLVSVGACIMGTMQGVRRVIALEPAEAMRPAPPPRGGSVLLERWPRFWSALDIQWQMVLRGLLRRRGRTTAGVVSAAFGASIVMLAFGFVDSLDAMIRTQFGKILRSDYHLTFGKELDRSVVDEVRRLPGVMRAEPVFTVPCTFESGPVRKKGAVIGIPPESRLTVPHGRRGEQMDLPPAGLLMADRLMEQLGLRAGDSVRLHPVKGHRDAVTAPVARGFPGMLGLSVYADSAWLNRLMSESGSVSEVRVAAMQNDEEQRTFMRALKDMPNLEGVTDIGGQKLALQKQMDGAMRTSAVIMIAFAAVIFFGAILNGTLISMAERQRELATFSALGYYDRETARLFLRENLVTNLAGTLVGLPLGALMLARMMTSFETDAYSFPAVLEPSSFLYTVALAIVFVAVSQLAVYRNLDQLNRVEALNLKE